MVVREPISRAVSSYCHLVRHAHLPALPLNEGLRRCFDAFELRGDPFPEANVLSYGLYGQFLRKWYASYSESRFLILSQKQMLESPGLALKQVASHLEIHPEPLLEALKDGSMKESNIGLYDPAMLRLARLGSLLKTRPIPGTSRRTPSALPSRIPGYALSRVAEIAAGIRGQKRETLTDENRAMMEHLYEADFADVRATVPAEALYWAPRAHA